MTVHRRNGSPIVSYDDESKVVRVSTNDDRNLSNLVESIFGAEDAIDRADVPVKSLVSFDLGGM